MIALDCNRNQSIPFRPKSLREGEADLAGFEPAIYSLGGCRPIQAGLQAQKNNLNTLN